MATHDQSNREHTQHCDDCNRSGYWFGAVVVISMRGTATARRGAGIRYRRVDPQQVGPGSGKCAW